MDGPWLSAHRAVADRFWGKLMSVWECAPSRDSISSLRGADERTVRAAASRRRPRAIALNRVITLVAVGGCFITLFITPLRLTWCAFDIALRTYLMFIAMVMAHEAAHGHLARTRRANDAWGWFALIPVMVGFSKFRRTHLLHHSYTNDTQREPH